MKFCTKCGNGIKEGQVFCTICGDDIGKQAVNKTENSEVNEVTEENKGSRVIEETNLVTNLPKENSKSNFKLSKTSKIVLLILTIVVVAIVALIQVGNTLTDPKKIVTRFERDVVSNNTSDLTKILYYNDARLTISSNNITPLLSYFKSNPSYFNKVIQDLNNDAISPKDISKLSMTSSNTLTLANTGKSYFIFPDCKIIIEPSFVDITTTVKDVTFSINDNQIGKSDSDNSSKEFGPYIPGNYSILANYKGKYVTLNKVYPVDLVSTIEGITKLSVFDDMSYLDITSDYPNAEIFVNAKDTNVKVKNATNFGPVDDSAKIYATDVIDGETLKSEEYSVTSEGTNINISFEDASNALNNVQAQLNDLLGYYASSLAEAINTNDSSLIASYVTPGSELYIQQQSNIPVAYADGIQESVVSANITGYNISNDSQSGSITTLEVYNITTKDGTSSNKAFKHVYKFQYNDATSSYQFTQRQ